MDAETNKTVEPSTSAPKDVGSSNNRSVDNEHQQLPVTLPTPTIVSKPTTNLDAMTIANLAVQDVHEDEIEMKLASAPPTQPAATTTKQLQDPNSHGGIAHSPIAPRKSGYQPTLQGMELKHPPAGAKLGSHQPPAKLPVATPVRRVDPPVEDPATTKMNPRELNPPETAYQPAKATVKFILPAAEDAADPPMQQQEEQPAQARPNEKMPAKLKEPPETTQYMEDTDKSPSISKKNKIVIQKVECPHPKDVLFPTSGFQLWAGNVHFHRAIDTQRDMFLAANPNDRPQIASGIKKRILKEGGRFLRAIEIAPLDKNGEKNPMVICRTNWREMDDTTSIELVVKALSSDPQARSASRQRREARMIQRRRNRRLAQEAKAAAERATELELSIPGGPPSGPLEVLYYVPPGRQTGTHGGRRKAGALPGVRPKVSSKANKLMQPPKTIGYSFSSSTSSDSESTLESSPPKTQGSKKRAKGVKRGAPKAPLSAKKQAKIAAITGESGADGSLNADGSAIVLPKGVTIRPSGKWQAQTYFAGQSRYVGVFDTSEMAAAAYNVCQAFIRNYKRNNVSSDSSKESLAMVFAAARLQADRAVKELLEKKRAEKARNAGS